MNNLREKTFEEKLNDLFEAKLHDAGFGSEIIPVESFEEAVDKALEYLETHRNISQTKKDTGVNYQTPLNLDTKIITQRFKSKIHLVSGISDKEALSGYYKNPEQKHISMDGYGIKHIIPHIKHWTIYYNEIISKNPYYKEKLKSYGINKNNSNLKNMLLFAKYAIDVGGCKNQQKRLENGDHVVSIIFDGWNIVFGYDDSYLGDNNTNDFTYLETMYYTKANQTKQSFFRQQTTNNQKNNNYMNSIKNKTHPNYNKIKDFDDKLAIENNKIKED